MALAPHDLDLSHCRLPAFQPPPLQREGGRTPRHSAGRHRAAPRPVAQCTMDARGGCLQGSRADGEPPGDSKGPSPRQTSPSNREWGPREAYSGADGGTRALGRRSLPQEWRRARRARWGEGLERKQQADGPREGRARKGPRPGLRSARMLVGGAGEGETEKSGKIWVWGWGTD